MLKQPHGNAVRLDRDRERLIGRFLGFAMAEPFHRHHMRARDTFWGKRLHRLAPDDADALEANPASEGGGLTWALFDAPTDDKRGATILKRFIESPARGSRRPRARTSPSSIEATSGCTS